MQFISGSVEESMRHLPFMGGDLPAELNRLKGSMRRLAVPKVGAVFEELGFTYMGPIDGTTSPNDPHLPGGPSRGRTCSGSCAHHQGRVTPMPKQTRSATTRNRPLI